MSEALLLSALLMGLTGGPHCAAMCGTACAGIARNGRGLLQFQIGRIAGYATLGAVGASAFQGVGWLAGATAVARPLWTLFHLGVMLLGLSLLWQARQPAWVDALGRSAWARVRGIAGRGGHGLRAAPAPLLAGALWAFMPCGLLYSALMLAVLSGHAAGGAAVMAVFAAGSAVSLALGPWLWRRWRSRMQSDAAVRIAGAALVGVSGWALWIGMTHQELLWCVAP